MEPGLVMTSTGRRWPSLGGSPAPASMVIATLDADTVDGNGQFTGPRCPSVALGGYLLGGGMGWNHAHWGGIACHSVRSMEIITADGNKVTASPTTNKELYWAARGAGPGFFGVVTQYELDLYTAPQAIFGSMYIHPLDNLDVVTESLEQLVRIKAERVEILLLFMHNHQAPPGTPHEQAKICFVGMNAFADSAAEARSMLSPFADVMRLIMIGQMISLLHCMRVLIISGDHRRPDHICSRLWLSCRSCEMMPVFHLLQIII